MTNEELEAALVRGSSEFVQIREALTSLRQQVASMQTDVAETKEIVAAWNAVKNGGRFVKWAGGIIMTVAGAYAAIKLGVTKWL